MPKHKRMVEFTVTHPQIEYYETIKNNKENFYKYGVIFRIYC